VSSGKLRVRASSLLVIALATWARATLAADTPAADVLRGAFENLYGYDVQMVLNLELHDGTGEVSIRRAEIARKRIRGRTHSFAHFLEPSWMRGTRMLLVDNTDRSDDVFLFLPENEWVRRLNTVQRQDSFLGSDFWYEDLERREVGDYRILAVTHGVEDGRQTSIIDAEPVREATSYARIRFIIEDETLLMRQILFYRTGATEPLREISFDRSSLIEQDGFEIETRFTVTNHLRRTSTAARFDRLQVNPKLSNALFKSTALLTKRRIPGLTDGAEEGE